MRVREHLFPGEHHPMPNRARNTRGLVKSEHYKIYFLSLRCHLALDRPRRKTFFGSRRIDESRRGKAGQAAGSPRMRTVGDPPPDLMVWCWGGKDSLAALSIDRLASTESEPNAKRGPRRGLMALRRDCVGDQRHGGCRAGAVGNEQGRACCVSKDRSDSWMTLIERETQDTGASVWELCLGLAPDWRLDWPETCRKRVRAAKLGADSWKAGLGGQDSAD